MASKSTLFKLTHLLLIAGALLMLLLALLAVLGEGALLVGYFNLDGNHLGIPAVINDADIPGHITRDLVFAVAIPYVAVLMAATLVFALIFQQTAKIVESTILGDPFVGENAIRLSRIGWLLLGMQIAGWVTMWMLDPLMQHLPKEANLDLGFNFSPVGLLGILLIFVLAQVFRRGSEMRAELEATV